MRRKSAEIEQKIFKEMMTGSRKGVKGADVNEGDKNEDLASKESKPSRFGDIKLQLDYDHSKSDFSVLVMQCHNLLDASSIAKLQNRSEYDPNGETGGLHDEQYAAQERHSETGSKQDKKKKEDVGWLELDDVPKVNAFVKLCLLPDVRLVKKTKVATRTNHPQYMQKFHFKVAKSELETRRLLVTVWNQQFLRKKSFLGEAIIPLQYDNFNEKVPRLYPLRTTETYSLPTQPAALAYRGEISLKICFSTTPGGPDANTANNGDEDDEDIDIDEMGTLVVELQEARSLLNPRKRSCNAHCTCALFDVEKQRKNAADTATEVIRKSNNPMWNKRFEFENESIYSLQQKCLEVSVWHNGKKQKKTFLGGARLNLATTAFSNGAVVQSPVRLPPWMDAKGDESLLWYAVTERPNNWIEASLPLRSFLDNALAGSSEKLADPAEAALEAESDDDKH